MRPCFVKTSLGNSLGQCSACPCLRCPALTGFPLEIFIQWAFNTPWCLSVTQFRVRNRTLKGWRSRLFPEIPGSAGARPQPPELSPPLASGLLAGEGLPSLRCSRRGYRKLTPAPAAAFPTPSAYLCCRDFLGQPTPPGFLFPRCLKGFITFLCLLQGVYQTLLADLLELYL